MAVSNNWQQATSAAAASSLTLANYAVGSGNNKILIVVTGAKDSGGTQDDCIPSTVAWGVRGLTQVKAAANTLESGFGQGAVIWALLAPPAETHDIVATWPEAQSVAAQMSACYLIDREQVLPTTLTNSATSVADTGTTKWTLTINAVPANAYVLDCCSSSQTGGTHSATESAQVQKVNNLLTSSFLLASEREVAAVADVTFGWVASVSSGRRGHVMAAFKAAVTGGGGTTHRRVLWAPSGTPQVNIAGAYTAQDVNGTSIAATGTHFLGVQPIYIFGDVVVTMAPGQDLLLADNASDFSLVQDQSGWRYQWLIGTTYTDAEVDSVVGDWMKTGDQYWQINATHQEAVVAADLTTKISAVRKWTVPADYRLRIQGTWTCGSGSGADGADVWIVHWHGATSTIRFRRVALLGTQAVFNQVLDVVAGDVIEFRAGVGPALNHSYDDTVLQALIYSTTAALTTADDDQAPLTAPGDPNLTDPSGINDGLTLFVGGHPAGSEQAGTERITRNKLLFVNGDALLADVDFGGWVVPETLGVNGAISFGRPSTWNADVGTRFALWMDVVINAVDSFSFVFSIPWRDAWSSPYVALSFGRNSTTNQAVLQLTPASGTLVAVTGPTNSWPTALGRHKIGFVRDGASVYFFLDGAQVGAAVATAGTSAPGWDVAAKQKNISLLGRSDTAATSQGVAGVVEQMRFWVIPTGTTAAQMITRMVTLQTAPNTGRFTGGIRTRLPLGTIENHGFAQAPSPSYSFNPTSITQALAAGIPLYGIRHNLTQVTDGGYGVGSFAGPWYYDHVYNSHVPYATQWDVMHDNGIYLLGCLFEGGSGSNYPFPKTATERAFWADQAVAMMKYVEAGWPGMLVAVEVENEPDGNWAVPLDADSAHGGANPYAMGLIAAALKLKVRAEPSLDHIAIIAPANVGSPTQKHQDAIINGICDSIDYWSIHIYAPSDKWMSRETIMRPWFTTAGHANMKFIMTEWGGHGSSNCYESTSDLAAMLAMGSVVGSSYYPLREFSGWINTALIEGDGSLAPQGRTYLTFRSLVGMDAHYVGADNLASNVISYHFTTAVGGTHVRVMWSFTDEPTSIDITGTYTIKDYFGNALNTGAFQVLSVQPYYVFGNVTVALSAAGNQDTLLTDNFVDFSTTQGLHGWTYQYLEGTAYTNATADSANNRWIHPSYSTWQLAMINVQAAGKTPIYHVAMTPVTNSAGTGMVCSVQKWTVPSGVARVRVRMMWHRGSGGDGTGVSLWSWRGATATLRYRKTDLNGTSVDFVQVFDVQQNDVIEFRADTGPALDDVSDQTLLYKCIIYETSGPVTAPQDNP